MDPLKEDSDPLKLEEWLQSRTQQRYNILKKKEWKVNDQMTRIVKVSVRTIQCRFGKRTALTEFCQ